ncbi:MAG: hypothetical protein OER86_12715 [Phycisphaerae bacterium]|nr:hypothetical protein [Phycisphaerae bacterium]
MIRRRGMVSVMAVAMIGVVAVAVVALTARLGREHEHGARLRRHAQLQQMLMAGAQSARRLVPGQGIVPDREVLLSPRSLSVPIPPELQARGGRVTLLAVPEATGLGIEIQVVATLGRREARQKLRYVRTDRGWRPGSAELGS